MSQDIRIDAQSTILITRGMASSAVDIATMATATTQYLEYQLDESALVQLCVSPEPTDSTVFRQLTLFDCNDASTRIAYEAQPQFDLLVLESPETLLTAGYHRMPHQSELPAGAPALKRAWEEVQEACISQSPYRMDEAATLSAITSQLLLPRPSLDSSLTLAEGCDLYDVSVAHSSSVVGLMLDRKRHDADYIKWMLTQRKLTERWPKQHLLRMVTGGVGL